MNSLSSRKPSPVFQSRIGSSGGDSDPEQVIVAIVCPGGIGILGGLVPKKHTLFQVVAVFGGIAQGIGSRGGIIPAKPSPWGRCPSGHTGADEGVPEGNGTREPSPRPFVLLVVPLS